MFTSFESTLKEKLESRIASKDKFFSLEFFPPKTRSGAFNLMLRLERMGMGSPLFVDVTWHPAGNPSGDLETSSTMIAHSVVNYVGLETMLHMTCVGSTRESMVGYINKAKGLGIRNLLALRGDPLASDTWEFQESGLNSGKEVVELIRKEFGEEFTVCVAGYPSGHPEAPSYEDDIVRLKEKVDAGADFVITQLFFRAQTFKKFVDDCRAIGISQPILPGLSIITAITPGSLEVCLYISFICCLFELSFR
jgi:methylenetetrahydrofolate reductase (NADPH)